MSKKIIIALVIVLLPVFIFALDEVIDKDHWAYKDIQYLVDAKVITMPLTKDTLTREEVVGYINNGVDNILLAAKTKKQTGEQNASVKEYIDKLYNLVKAYQTDMMTLGQKLDSIEETLGDLKAKKQELEQKQDKLLNGMGMRINGESAAYMTDLLLFGSKNSLDTLVQNAESEGVTTAASPGNIAALRYRPITQYIDLMFSLHANKELYSEATFRLENVFGGFWGSQDIIGLKRFFIQGDYPIAFIFGDYQAKMTPFTIWAVDDDRPFESTIFSDKRDMNKKELYLIDDSWPVQGLKASTIINLFNTLDLNLDVMGARLGEADMDQPNTGYFAVPFEGDFTGGNSANGDLGTHTLPGTVYSHDQYMGAGRISTDATLKNILNVGVNFVEIKDAKDTGPDYNAPTLDNYVTSADGSIKLFNIATIKAEYAISDYCVDFAGEGATTPLSWENTYLSDKALKADLIAEAFGTKLDISFRDVGNSFTAYAAQSRIYDEGNNPWQYYVTQNNTYNVSLPMPTYMIGGSTMDNFGKVYPLTRYNNSIITMLSGNYNPIGSNLMAYPFFENNSTPYGDATPNRQGFSIKLTGDYFDDLLLPYIKFQDLSEIVSDVIVNGTQQPRNYTVIEAGVKINLGDDLSITAGYKNEVTDNNSNINLTSNIIDAGINYTLIKKVTLSVGMKDIAFNGNEYFEAVENTAAEGTTAGNLNPGAGMENFNMNILSYGAGLSYKIAKPATLGVSYTLTTITDNNNPANSYGAQEVDANVTIKF